MTLHLQMGKLIFIFLILFCSSKCFAVADTCSIHNKNVLYTSSIKCISDFKKLSGNPDSVINLEILMQ